MAVLNVRSENHPTDDFEALGPSDNFSSFSFGLFLQVIVRAVTSKSMIKQEIFFRVKERTSKAGF